MPGTTPKGYPYAQPADPLVQWPATSQALAEKIDSTPTIVGNVAGLKICAGRTGSDSAVTFPAGFFSAIPTVIVSPGTDAADPGGDLTAVVGRITKDGCYVRSRIIVGSNTGTPYGTVSWIAIGV